MLAGFTALVAMHVIMNLTFGITPIAIARSAGGLFVQGLAGAVGGVLYISLNDRLFPSSPLETAK